MATAKKKVSSTDSGTTTFSTSSAKKKVEPKTTPIAPPVAPPPLLSERESGEIPNPLLGVTVEPPPSPKKRGRPPGSKATQKKKPEATTPQSTLPPEILAATAMLYSNLLVMTDLTPELSKPEQAAIVAALDGVVIKYGHLLEHAPLVVLAATMLLPIVPRVMEKRKRDSEPRALPAANVEPKVSAE